MRIIIDKTGPDWEPTEERKWYAQCDQLPFTCPIDYAFGPTPEKALDNLIKFVEGSGHKIA